MNQAKEERRAAAESAAVERRRRHCLSLLHCLSRSNVMRYHHDGLVLELSESGEEFSDIKKVRFSAYIAFWFTALTGVIERYEHLRNSGALPPDEQIDSLLTEEFKAIVKPFRNSVAHCSDHDDSRTLRLYEVEHAVPDHAAALAGAFDSYLRRLLGEFP